MALQNQDRPKYNEVCRGEEYRRCLSAARKGIQRPDNIKPLPLRTSSGKSDVQKDAHIARQGPVKGCKFRKAVKSQRAMGRGRPDRQQMAPRRPWFPANILTQQYCTHEVADEN